MRKMILLSVLLVVLLSGCVNNEIIGNDTGNDTVVCIEGEEVKETCEDSTSVDYGNSIVIKKCVNEEWISQPIPTFWCMAETKGEEVTTSAVSIVGYSFVPNEITVSPGTTVIWTNTDTKSHAIGSSKFDTPGTLKVGESWNYTFDTPGTYAFTCPFHYAKGKVIVTT